MMYLKIFISFFVLGWILVCAVAGGVYIFEHVWHTLNEWQQISLVLAGIAALLTSMVFFLNEV